MSILGRRIVRLLALQNDHEGLTSSRREIIQGNIDNGARFGYHLPHGVLGEANGAQRRRRVVYAQIELVSPRTKCFCLNESLLELVRIGSVLYLEQT